MSAEQTIQTVEKILEYLGDETQSLGYADTQLLLEILKENRKQTQVLESIAQELRANKPTTVARGIEI